VSKTVIALKCTRCPFDLQCTAGQQERYHVKTKHTSLMAPTWAVMNEGKQMLKVVLPQMITVILT